jgi:hypothetical protein
VALFFVASGALQGAFVPILGYRVLNHWRYSKWFIWWTGFGVADVWRFLFLGYCSGAIAGTLTNAVYAVLNRRPAAPWMRDHINAAVTIPIALVICLVWGPSGDYIDADVIKASYLSFVGCVAAYDVPWLGDYLDVINVRVCVRLLLWLS